jgi:queuosine precursor transporter
VTRPAAPERTYRYLDAVMVAFVVVLVCANLIGPGKAAQVPLPWWGPFTFSAGIVFIPLSYVFGDILTEVYGYSRARRVIWAGFAALAFSAIMAAIVVSLPPAPGWPHQAAYDVAFGNLWRVVIASMVAYFCGEFVNSYVLAKMKVASGGRNMGARFVLSTFAAEAVDSAIFYPLAFYNSAQMSNDLVFTLIWSQFGLKTAVEILMLPVTCWIVGFLKRGEGEDYFDRDTDFSPFKV